MKISKTKTILETHKYSLSNNLFYNIEFKNGKEINRHLTYTGKNIDGYDLHPVYDNDDKIRLLLKKWNPCWGPLPGTTGSSIIYNDKTFKNLPEPEKIDLKKIIFVQFSTHRFFDFELKPEPVVIKGDYIGAGLSNEHYDLEKLKKYLDNHSRIIECSDILDIPHYNSTYECNKYLEVTVLPKKNDIKKIKCFNADNVFGEYYDKKGVDYLGIKKFLKK